MPLTGRFDFRRTVSGKLLLLLEEDVAARWSPFRKPARRRRWRRARVLRSGGPRNASADGPPEQAKFRHFTGAKRPARKRRTYGVSLRGSSRGIS